VSLLLAVGLAGAAVPAGAESVTCLGWELTESVGTLVGTSARDILLGTAADETISGLGGNDVICGGGGNDLLYGGAGFDNLDGGDGNDSLYGQGGCDYLRGGAGNDVLWPGPSGQACAGTLDGHLGRDRMVISAAGRNDVFGGPGRDTLDFRRSPVGVVVNLGLHPPTYDFVDVLTTNSAVYDIEVVFGSKYADILGGGDGNDDLRGFGGDDTLFGGNGDDHLVGGDGTDTVNGWNGTDTCDGEDMQLCNP
jgi:Ca2+-binding RTX toxin-like protein